MVPLVTIPISILGAIAAMSAMGFSLNLLTVLAIVLSVGLVVDDAIVVVENVARFMRQGMSRTRAALLSSPAAGAYYRHDADIGRRLCSDRLFIRFDRGTCLKSLPLPWQLP